MVFVIRRGSGLRPLRTHTAGSRSTQCLISGPSAPDEVGHSCSAGDQHQPGFGRCGNPLLLQGINHILSETPYCDTDEEFGATCLDAALQVTDSQLGFIAETTGNDQLVLMAVSVPDRYAQGLDMVLDLDSARHMQVRGIYGRVILDGTPLLTNDPSSHSASIGTPQGHPPLDSFLGAPLLHDGRVIGMIAVANRKGGYTHDDLENLVALSHTTVGALIRRRAVEALRASQEELDFALDAARMGTWSWDPERDVSKLDPRAADILGVQYSHDFIPTSELMRNVHPEDLDKLQYTIQSACDPEGTDRFYIEFRWRRPDGTLVWLLEKGRVLFENAGGCRRAVRVTGTIVDITDRKWAEWALRESEERYRLLVQELKEAAERKSEFLGLLSHEIRNPLTAITMCLSLLQDSEHGTDQRADVLEVMDRQVRQLTRLIDDLLEMTRMAKDKIRLDKKRHDLNGIVRSVVEDHRLLFESKGIALSLELPSGETHVDADSIRLSQVIGNLLNNAAKFTPESGRVRVVVSRDAVHGCGIVQVIDDGIGIEPAMVSQVFEPFVQACPESSQTSKGLGLGLCLVRLITELHGGQVSAHSPGPGRGSVFTVRLPLPVRSHFPDASANSSLSPTHNKRILLVDDNVSMVRTMCMLLNAEGYSALACYDGMNAVAKAREWRPDIVICDIGLPGRSGYEVAEAMRADESLRDTTLIALTGCVCSEDREPSKSTVFAVYLSKPIEFDTLKTVLAKTDR